MTLLNQPHFGEGIDFRQMFLITGLGHHIESIAELGDGESQLAAHLREKIQNYDIDGILKLLDEVRLK